MKVAVLGSVDIYVRFSSIKVANVDSRLGDSAGSMLQDLVVHGTNASILGSVALGDMAPAPGVLEFHGSKDIWTVLAGFSLFYTRAHQLETGGGRG
jgi:myosin-crossreactive antigen